MAMESSFMVVSDVSPQAWDEYLSNTETVSNKRLRPQNVSFWDAMLSKEADFTATTEGKQIAKLIKEL